MSQSVVPQTAEERRASDAKAAAEAEKNAPKQLDALHTEHGDTTIADGVVATPGAEPVAESGYGAAVLLDPWLTLGRADLRARALRVTA